MVEPRKYSLRAIDVVNEARTLLRAMADAGKRGLPRSREKLRRRRVYAVSMKTRPMPGARCSPRAGRRLACRGGRRRRDGGGERAEGEETTPAAGGVEKVIKKRVEKVIKKRIEK